MARDSTREQRSCRSRNGPSFSRAAMMSSTAASPTFLIAERPKRIDLSFTVKTLPLSFTLGGKDGDAHRLRLGDEERDLVGVVEFVGEQRGHELDRVARLEPRGLVGDDAVAGGVGLVEAVAGEFVEDVEELVGLFGGDVVFLRAALDENGALLGHFLRLSFCPWRGAARRRRRACSRRGPARPA